ncbi:NAD-dependent epimerase/dehydratase family protein [Candidatus Kapabacteria bacterium]|nr:NAD-dependent epimerase/dehydratase family protein [Candidatus Kapabacteria bacterium]
MKKILITGALGQIGSELSLELARRYGRDNIILTDIREEAIPALSDFKYYKVDVRDKASLKEILENNKIDSIFHLAAILSANGEKNPQFCWDVNMNGSLNILDLGIELKLSKIFIPSSIAAFGDGIDVKNTIQDSVLRPSTMYGVTKVAGESIGNYYFEKFGLDVRGLRYPGIISSETLPGGGTTDYAVEIFYEAIKNKKYESFLKEDAVLPMMYMPDCINATIQLMEADVKNLRRHADYNLAAISFAPKDLAQEIKKIIPEFEISYKPDYRQEIADSWPQTIDDSYARKDWAWEHEFGIEAICKDMIDKLSKKL